MHTNTAGARIIQTRRRKKIQRTNVINISDTKVRERRNWWSLVIDNARLIYFNLFEMTKMICHVFSLDRNNWCISSTKKNFFESTFIHANPCLFRILDKLFVLVLHHRLLKERMTTTTLVLSILILTCICLQNNGSL